MSDQKVIEARAEIKAKANNYGFSLF